MFNVVNLSSSHPFLLSCGFSFIASTIVLLVNRLKSRSIFCNKNPSAALIIKCTWLLIMHHAKTSNPLRQNSQNTIHPDYKIYIFCSLYQIFHKDINCLLYIKVFLALTSKSPITNRRERGILRYTRCSQ